MELHGFAVLHFCDVRYIYVLHFRKITLDNSRTERRENIEGESRRVNSNMPHRMSHHFDQPDVAGDGTRTTVRLMVRLNSFTQHIRCAPYATPPAITLDTPVILSSCLQEGVHTPVPIPS